MGFSQSTAPAVSTLAVTVSVASNLSPTLGSGLNISAALRKTAEVALCEFHYLAIKAAWKSERQWGDWLRHAGKRCSDRLKKSFIFLFKNNLQWLLLLYLSVKTHYLHIVELIIYWKCFCFASRVSVCSYWTCVVLLQAQQQFRLSIPFPLNVKDSVLKEFTAVKKCWTSLYLWRTVQWSSVPQSSQTVIRRCNSQCHLPVLPWWTECPSSFLWSVSTALACIPRFKTTTTTT